MWSRLKIFSWYAEFCRPGLVKSKMVAACVCVCVGHSQQEFRGKIFTLIIYLRYLLSCCNSLSGLSHDDGARFPNLVSTFFFSCDVKGQRSDERHHS